MMIHSDEKGIQILGGRIEFRSAFLHKKRKVRNRAHRRIVEELKARGYYSNGRKPPELPKIPEIPDITEASWDEALDPKKFFAGSMAALQDLLKTLEKPREKVRFYQNPDTGNTIQLDDLIAATHLWPIEEIMEMIPEQPAYDVKEKLGKKMYTVALDVNGLRSLANGEPTVFPAND